MVNAYNTHIANQGIPFDEMQAVCVDLLRDPCHASNENQGRELEGEEEVLQVDTGVRPGGELQGETFDVVVVSATTSSPSSSSFLVHLLRDGAGS